MGDEDTQTQLQKDLGMLQEEWENLHSLLGRRMDLTEAITKVSGRFVSNFCNWALTVTVILLGPI